MAKTISILGLGWLGLPLAKSLATKGYKVKGSVTSAEKINSVEDPGIDVSVVKIEADTIYSSYTDFFKTDILFINIPPRRIPNIETGYPAQIAQVLPFITENKIGKVIFISSTSVYPETNSEVDENNLPKPEKGSGVACLNAEQILQQQSGFATTVIRFGGLIGADRNPYRFMQRGVKNGPGQKPINLIHMDDCIGIIHHIIENEIWGEVINGCCPIHPTRAEFYHLAAKVVNVDAQEFDESDDFSFKIVSSKKLIDKLGYSFKYESPMDYLKEAHPYLFPKGRGKIVKD